MRWYRIVKSDMIDQSPHTLHSVGRISTRGRRRVKRGRGGGRQGHQISQCTLSKKGKKGNLLDWKNLFLSPPASCGHERVEL